MILYKVKAWGGRGGTRPAQLRGAWPQWAHRRSPGAGRSGRTGTQLQYSWWWTVRIQLARHRRPPNGPLPSSTAPLSAPLQLTPAVSPSIPAANAPRRLRPCLPPSSPPAAERPVCLVTGASRGIGKAIALALGKQGARVSGAGGRGLGAMRRARWTNGVGRAAAGGL